MPTNNRGGGYKTEFTAPEIPGDPAKSGNSGLLDMVELKIASPPIMQRSRNGEIRFHLLQTPAIVALLDTLFGCWGSLLKFQLVIGVQGVINRNLI